MDRFTAFALVVSTALCLSGCDTLSGTSNIEYRVTGTATRVSLTYESDGGGTSQISSAALPWSYALKARKGDFLYVSAQIIEGNGSVTAAIYKSGDLFKSSTSSGFASIATANGSLE